MLNLEYQLKRMILSFRIKVLADEFGRISLMQENRLLLSVLTSAKPNCRLSFLSKT
jgi:hypothetical protein